MVIHLKITMDSDTEIKEPMTGKSIQHMVKKSHTCLNIRISGSIQIYF